MKLDLKWMRLFSISALTAGTLSSASIASAGWRQYHAPGFCRNTVTGAALGYSSKQSYAALFAGLAPVNVECPIIETSTVPKGYITGVAVYGTVNTGQVSAQTCIAYRLDPSSPFYPDLLPGGACDSQASSGSGYTGNFSLAPSRYYWTSAHYVDFAYVNVTIPATSELTGSNYVRGYTTFY